jgi:hypothetical protein
MKQQPEPAVRSILVSGLGMINVLIACLFLAAALAMAGVGSWMAADQWRSGRDSPIPVQEILPIIIVTYIIYVAWGLLRLMAGLGVVRRQRSGRVLALLLNGVDSASALGLVVGGTLNYPADAWALAVGVPMLAYCATVFLVLFHPRYAAEFTPPPSRRRTSDAPP